MSAATPTARSLAPTPYLLGVPLPQFANTEDAYITAIPLSSSTNTLTYSPVGRYVDVPLSIVADYTTDGTIASRTMNGSVADASGTLLWFMHAAAVQTASQRITYSFNAQLSTAYAQGGTQILPLPALPLQAGYTVTLAAGLAAAGDSWSLASITVMRIGSSGPITTPALTLVPTPLIT